MSAFMMPRESRQIHIMPREPAQIGPREQPTNIKVREVSIHDAKREPANIMPREQPAQIGPRE